MSQPEQIQERLQNRIKQLKSEIELKQTILKELESIQDDKDLPF